MGWQVGALKSGYLADLLVPQVVPAKASYFLDSVQLDEGEAYSYEREPPQFRPATTAIGLLCRMYLGVDHENEILGRGVERADTACLQAMAHDLDAADWRLADAIVALTRSPHFTQRRGEPAGEAQR